MKKVLCLIFCAILLLSFANIYAADYHIAVITGSVSQSEDSYRGAEAFREMYGDDIVQVAVYPDNFTEEIETSIQTISKFADDPLMKAIVVSPAPPGCTEAFRQVRERRDDILLIAGEPIEDLIEISSAADVVVRNDFVSRGYLMIRNAHELGAKSFVHISFARHLGSEGTSRRVAIYKEACKEFGMDFIMETAPDPLSDVGVAGAQAYVLEKAPEWIEKYGTDSAYFCTNDAQTEPLIKQLLAYGGIFVEADLPSPLMGYPGALGLDFSDAGGDFEKILRTVENAIVEKGGAGRFGTWAVSNNYVNIAGLAQHAMNVLDGKSEILEIDDVTDAFNAFSGEVEWGGSNYVNVNSGVKEDKVILVFQDTYIMGNPGFYLKNTEVEIPEKYLYLK